MWKKHKKELEQKEKNPFHREYGIRSNATFIIGNMLRYDKMFLLLIPLGMLCAPFCKFLWTFLAKFILDLITEGKSTEHLFQLMLGFAAVQVLVTILETYSSSDVWWRFIGIRMKMIISLNAKAMGIDFYHLENSDVMDCFQKARNACNSNNEGIEGMMRQIRDLLISGVVVVTGIVIIGTMNVWMIGIFVVMTFLNFLLVNHTNVVAKKTVWDPLSAWWRKRYYMQETTTDFKEAKDIRMYGLKGWLVRKYRNLNEVRCDAQKTNAKLWLFTSNISGVIWLASQVFTYAWLIYAVIWDGMTIGNFSLYLTSAATLFEYFSGFLNQISSLLARSREVDDYRSFLDFDKENKQKNQKKLPKTDSYTFTFEEVSFCYPKSEQYALKNLNLTIHEGERLAVVGLNGAGKSTMIKLMLRLYEPTKGRILLNGIDIRTYDKESYYKAFAPVFQQVELFAFPLEENVSMKEPERTDTDWARKCLVAAGLEEKLKELPKGEKTELLKVIYDDGVDLSGGEKQKLALARALYKDAPVVILDEPTAALDALAEAGLYESFDKLIGNKTAVYISHRLSSTQFCDHVAMFADGNMVEYGTHENLLQQDGAYAEMFRIQAQYYVEDEEKETAYGEG